MLKWLSKKRNQKGFTLIELIVVIAILGILAAIAIPRLGGFTDSAKRSALEADAKTILTSISVLAAETNGDPEAAVADGGAGLTLEGDKDTVSAELTALTGDFDGSISEYTYSNGDISFTYATTEFTVDVDAGVVGTATAVTP